MSIQLSNKYGLNPSLMICFFCNKESSGVALLGNNGGKEAPRQAIYDMTPCHECKDLMNQGILLISVRNGEMEKAERDRELAIAQYERESSGKYRGWKNKHPFNWMPNPYRTGGWAVITEEAFAGVFNGPVVDQIVEMRWSFVPDEVWDAVGLPRGIEINNLDNASD